MTVSTKQRRMKIGMPVFFLSEEEMTIVPGIVMEEVSVRTISGINQFWKIMVGPPDERKIIDTRKLNNIDFYTSLDEIQEVLNSRIQEQIRVIQSEMKKTMNAAKNQLIRWYSSDVSVEQLKSSLSSSMKEQEVEVVKTESPLESIFKSKIVEHEDYQDESNFEVINPEPIVQQTETKKKRPGRKKKIELSDEEVEIAQSIIDSQAQTQFEGGPRIRKIRLEDGTEIDPTELS